MSRIQTGLQLSVVLGVVVVGLGLHLPGLAEKLRAQGISEIRLNIRGSIRDDQVQQLVGIHQRRDQVGTLLSQPQIQHLDLRGALTGGELLS